MIADEVRKEGFEIFKKGLVRRLSSNHFVAKTASAVGWQIVEIKQGKWICDCGTGDEWCIHLYAAYLHRTTSKIQPEPLDESHLKCRYCGSPDIARCGFRYNARGIARRYRCNDCQRKFSIPHVENTLLAKPAEVLWLVNEVGMLISKLTDLVFELNNRILMVSEEQPSENHSLQGP
jgi:predicted RNA-binding Zn-ribbon protein involved in translation (DUF1610 family)